MSTLISTVQAIHEELVRCQHESMGVVPTTRDKWIKELEAALEQYHKSTPVADPRRAATNAVAQATADLNKALEEARTLHIMVDLVDIYKGECNPYFQIARMEHVTPLTWDMPRSK